ncbi:hypothetical protein Q8G31_29960 [Priestia megaterium]|uniref:hypothetical protein n=1 Tax=Priestia megaterium TaxID=1404 RepID=UPI00272FDA08|nr:hypothetical protein [Priestia megaterium]MDP1383877.1 hypothetical protein [Priestia megaterium]MDP1428030.1 hypothetical protein [Priestia megaterium]
MLSNFGNQKLRKGAVLDVGIGEHSTDEQSESAGRIHLADAITQSGMLTIGQIESLEKLTEDELRIIKGY